MKLKERKIKGITGLNKAQLQSLLDGKKPESKSTSKTSSKPATNKTPKQLTMKEEDIPDNLKEKSYIFLKRKVEKIQNISNDPASTDAEKKNALKKLTTYKKAMAVAKDKQYGKKKK